jgi:transcriptional regulator with XRE-family HTH domain
VKITNINPSVIRELIKINPNTVSKINGIEKWANGTDYPTYDELVQLSELFNVPFGYFFLNNLEKFCSYSFRGLDNFKITACDQETCRCDTCSKLFTPNENFIEVVVELPDECVNGFTPCDFVKVKICKNCLKRFLHAVDEKEIKNA